MTKRLRKKQNAELTNYLDKIPAIRGGLVWVENNGFVTVKQQNTGAYNRIAQKLFGTPAVSNIDLDEFGSFVWRQIDGTRTIYEIGQRIREEFGDRAEPLYERLCTYFYTLENVKYVEYVEAGKKE